VISLDRRLRRNVSSGRRAALAQRRAKALDDLRPAE